MCVILLFLCQLAAVTAVMNKAFIDYTQSLAIFDDFKEKYGKNYESVSEAAVRLAIFADNVYKIEKHNQRFVDCLETYTMEINKYSDLLHYEFLLSHSLIGKHWTTQRPAKDIQQRNLTASSIDWRVKGAVTPVKDQKDCAASYAFASAGAIEGQNFRFNHKLVNMSVQEIIDCSDVNGTDGCRSGTIDDVYDYLFLETLEAEDTYSYINAKGSCRPRHAKGKPAVTLMGYLRVPRKKEQLLTQFLLETGPVAATIDSSKLQFYRSGIFFDRQCKNAYDDLDLAVLVVGFDARHNVPYYIVKNSWGEDWGEQGYVRMSRNGNNHCGIATEAAVPIVRPEF